MTEKPISTPEETPEETPEATPSESAVPEVSETPLPTVEVATPLPEQVTSPADNVEIIPETAPVAPAKTKKPTATKKPQATKKPAKTAAPVTPEQPQTPPPATADNSVATTNPPTGEALLGRFIQVNEYVNDSASGRQLIKFSVAGTEYYAYNTGKFITGNKGFYSVNGTTSGLYYNNLPIYNLTNIVSFTSDYVLPQSSSVLLSPNDLSGLTKAQMDIARNEIFARHGRTFKKADLQNYFNSKSWYHVNNNYNYSNERLNVSETEWANAELLLKYSK